MNAVDALSTLSAISAMTVLACALLISGRGPSRGRMEKGRPRIRLNRIRDGPRFADPPDPLDTAADIELFASCISAGLSTRDAARAVASVADAEAAWAEVAALLSIGVAAEQAFYPMSDLAGLRNLAQLAGASHRSGASLADGCRRIARELREDAADQRTAAAERAGVLIALPLAACFLPAFIILGLVPVVIGMGATMLNQ